MLPRSATPLASRRTTSKPKRKEKLLESCLAFFKAAVRAQKPAVLLFPKSGEVLSDPRVGSLLAVEGCRPIPPSCDKDDPAALPGILCLPWALPREFHASRSVAGVAASSIARVVTWSPPDFGHKEKDPPPGLENVAVNEALLASGWTTECSWRWEKLKHINALETDAAVTNLRQLAREGKDTRSVHILDSSCARGALTKGRSSARLLRPSLRKAAAICVAGGLFPAFVYGPTRLNVSDDPTREVPLRAPHDRSLLRGLEEEPLCSLCALSGASKNRSRWLRLAILLAQEKGRARGFVGALLSFPERHCDPVHAPGLFPVGSSSVHPAEVFAASVLKREKPKPYHLGLLLDLLPREGKDRFASEEDALFWTTGVYIHGSLAGLRKACSRFPLSSALVCKVVHGICNKFPFTSVALLRDVRSELHRDSNNFRGWPSLVFPIGSFTEGQVWVEGGACDSPLLVGPDQLWGELLPIADGPAWLFGQRRHCTLPWKGVRKVAVAYSVRDSQNLSLTERRQAQRIGFVFPKARSSFAAAKLGGIKLDFDSTLGFPGEGPRLLFLPLWILFLFWPGLAYAVLAPRNKADLLRAAKRSPAGLQGGRVVLPRTGSNRADLAAAFSRWLLEVGGFDLRALIEAKPLDAEMIADWLVCYGQDLYGSGRPYWHYAETVNAVTALRPVLRRQVQAAWDLGFAWLSEEPSTHHTAVPAVVLTAILAACLSWGWVAEAGCFALAFGGLMRIGEVLQATRSSLVLPEDMLNSQHYILVSIREPKTRNRGPRHQAAKIEAQDLVMIIIMAFRGLRGDQRLWPMSPQTLRKRLDTVLHRVGAAPGPRGARPIDLGSFRAGGATFLLQRTEDSELVRRRGRWASAKIMEIYLQEVSATVFLPSLPREQKHRVAQVAAGFSGILQQAWAWTCQGIERNIWYRLWPEEVLHTTGNNGKYGT